MFRKDALVAGVLFLIAFAVYWPLLDGPFLLWGDVYNITRNAYLQAGDLRSIWSEPDLGLFAPVTVSVWAFVWHFISQAPAVFHGLNLLFHTANAILIFLLLSHRSISFWSALLASLIFLLHPLQSESVSWISALGTVLATFFALTAIHFFLSRDRFSAVAALIFTAASFLAKPIFIFMPLALLIDFWRGEKARKVNHAPFLGSAVLTTVLAGVIGGTILYHQSPMEPDILARLLRFADSPGWFIQKFFWPLPLLPDYSRTVGTIVSNLLWLWGLGFFTVTALAVFFLNKQDSRVRLGGLLLVAAWVPVSGLFQFPAQECGAAIGCDFTFSSVADRYGYAMMVGFVLVLASLFERLGRAMGRSNLLQAGACVLFVALISALGVLSFQHTRRWETNEKLFSHILDHNPSSFFGHTYLGQTLINQGRLVDGVLHLETARKLKPLEAAPIVGLMLAKTQAQDHSEAVQIGLRFMANKALVHHNARSPLLFELLSILGYNLATIGRVEEAHRVLCHARQISELARLDQSTQKNLKMVEDLMTAAQKPFQPCND